MKNKLAITAVAVVTIFLTNCDDKPSDLSVAPDGASSTRVSRIAGTEAGARELLSAFLKPDADRKALSAALRPANADYEAVFTADLAAKLRAAHAPMWDAGQGIGPNEGQTEILLHGVPSAEIKAWTQNASNILPGGYERVKDQINDGLTIYRFKFVKPGESLGMAFDGLVHVNGNWRLFPKPWRAAE